MSRRHPWYKRYPSDFIAGTAMLTAEEKGVYSTIIDLLHDRGGPIEDSPADLARICGCATPKRFQGIKERLVKLGKIAVAGGHITNARFERDRASSAKGGSDIVDDRVDEAQNRPPDLLEINGLSAPRSQKPDTRGQKGERGARAPSLLPEEFTLDETDVGYAEQHGFNAQQAAAMFESFCDHHRARGNKMLDWKAAWRTWVRNEIKFRQQRQGGAYEGNRAGTGTGSGFAAFSASLRARGAGGQG